MGRHTIPITNGKGSIRLVNGNYKVSAVVEGYDPDSIEPKNVTIVEGTNTYAFTIKANGTLTIHVTDTGIPETGVQVIGAKFVRTDSTGNILSEEITTDTDGNNKAIENDVELADGTIFPFKYVLDTKRIPHILGIQRAEYLSERSYY